MKTKPNYHVLLGGPTVLAEQTLSPPSRYGKLGTKFRVKVGLVDINWFDAQIQSLISAFSHVQPNTLPIFLTYDVSLTQNGGCCIGDYHSFEGSASAPQAYSHFTYIDHPGAFSQDVSALSHEVGKWMDDPLEGNANYGGYPYVLHGFTYNLQDLVTLPYFGAPPSTSVNNFFTRQGESFSVPKRG